MAPYGTTDKLTDVAVWVYSSYHYECQFASLFWTLLHGAIYCSLQIHIQWFKCYILKLSPLLLNKINENQGIYLHHYLSVHWKHHLPPPIKNKHLKLPLFLPRFSGNISHVVIPASRVTLFLFWEQLMHGRPGLNQCNPIDSRLMKLVFPHDKQN